MNDVEYGAVSIPGEQISLRAMSIFGEAELGNTRRNDRVIRLLSRLGTRPGGTLPPVTETQAEAKGAYHFLESEHLSAQDLWKPIHQHAAKHLESLKLALAIHDTTFFVFSSPDRIRGLGTVNDKPQQQGLLMHTTLLSRPDGFVLGTVHNDVWARRPEQLHQAERRKERPIQEKESFKWIEGIRHAHELRDQFGPSASLLHIADRESDVHEVLQEILQLRDHCVIRCSQDRRVDSPQGTVRATMAARPLKGVLEVQVPRSPGKPARKATVEIRSAELHLVPPKHLERKPLTIHAVWVHEFNPPAGQEPLDWMLYTTLPVDELSDCIQAIEFYKKRWLIEDYHLTLKSGCKIEKSQLEEASRIEKLLSLHSVVAVQVLQLRQAARTEPDAPCTILLTQTQWQVLMRYVLKEPMAADQPPPTIRQAVLWIGRLGGHLNRKSDGMPGVRSLWIGWRRLADMVEGFQLRPT